MYGSRTAARCGSTTGGGGGVGSDRVAPRLAADRRPARAAAVGGVPNVASRLVSYGRPSYGGSRPNAGRDVASAAADVAGLADALEIERFAVMGASGGGPHALACAALLGGG